LNPAFSKQRFTTEEAILQLQLTPAALSFVGRQTMAVLQQGHLGRQMAAFSHLHHTPGSSELKAHVIPAPV
jgi:hypothetical protein